MRVPRELLRSTITVRRYTGAGARGPLFADPVSIRAQVQPTSRLVTDTDGRDVTTTALAVIRPEDGPLEPETRVTYAGHEHRVIQCYPMPDERRPSHYEVMLAVYSASSRGGSGS